MLQNKRAKQVPERMKEAADPKPDKEPKISEETKWVALVSSERVRVGPGRGELRIVEKLRARIDFLTSTPTTSVAT